MERLERRKFTVVLPKYSSTTKYFSWDSTEILNVKAVYWYDSVKFYVGTINDSKNHVIIEASTFAPAFNPKEKGSINKAIDILKSRIDITRNKMGLSIEAVVIAYEQNFLNVIEAWKTLLTV